MQAVEFDSGNHGNVVASPADLCSCDARAEPSMPGTETVHFAKSFAFKAISLQTRAFRFNREAANTR